MRTYRVRSALAGSLAALLLTLTVCSATVVSAAPTTGVSLPPGSRSIGQQAHKKPANVTLQEGSSARSTSPQLTVTCYIYDFSSQSGRTVNLQSAVDCSYPATIDQTDYLDFCSYWSYQSSYCSGGWVRQGGGIHCSISRVTFATCPATNPLPITIAVGTVVQTDFVVTTTIPGTTPPTVTDTYYGNIYFIN